jgi:hypothetical protein
LGGEEPRSLDCTGGVGSALGAGVYKVLEFLSGVIKGKKALQGHTITNNYVFHDNRVI